MPNATHLNWFLNGAAYWNKKREELSFAPDLESANISVGVKNETTVLQSGSEPDPDTGEVASVGHKIANSEDFYKSNLSKADMRFCKLVALDHTEVDFEDANLRGANFRNTILKGAKFFGADVRKLWTTKSGSDGDLSPIHTDLSGCVALSQEQVDGMRGDTGTKLPEDLALPTEWPDWQHVVPARDEIQEKRMLEREVTKKINKNQAERVIEGIRRNGPAIELHSLDFLDKLHEFREKIRVDNQLDSDLREEIFEFLDDTLRCINNLASFAQPLSGQATDLQTTRTWAADYKRLAYEELARYLAPENAAAASVLLGIISGFAVTGALVGLPFNAPHVGFGVGGYVGNLVSRPVKPGKAIQSIQSEFDVKGGNGE